MYDSNVPEKLIMERLGHLLASGMHSYERTSIAQQKALHDMAKLEKVQRRATRILPTLRNLSYKERLHHLNLPSILFILYSDQHWRSLSYWQFRGDMLTTFQILNGFVDLDAAEFFYLSTTTHTRGHSYKLFTRHTRIDEIFCY